MGGAPSGRMGEQGGLRTGWLAAFGTEGYDGEPPLLEELGVNFGHIRDKVRPLPSLPPSPSYAPDPAHKKISGAPKAAISKPGSFLRLMKERSYRADIR